MSEPIAIVPPRVAFLDPRTGDISRQWYLLILAIVNRLGGAQGMTADDLAIGTLVGNAEPGLEALLSRLETAVGSQPIQTVSAEVAELRVDPAVQYANAVDDLTPATPYFGITDDVTPVKCIGTLGDQNADRVSITGGAVDNTPIGATAASTGKFTTVTSNGGATFMSTSAALANGAAAAGGTILNAPVAGNPTKWIGINDNGTVRYIPAW